MHQSVHVMLWLDLVWDTSGLFDLGYPKFSQPTIEFLMVV